MENKQSKLSILTRGIIKENPVLVLILGSCPTLATTTVAINGLGMGVSTMVVLICSNIIIYLHNPIFKFIFIIHIFPIGRLYKKIH